MATALESELKDLRLEDDSIKPGLFHLSLNLLYQPDSDTLNDRKKLLYIQIEDEHPTVHLILKNLVALINHRLPRSQNEVRSILESIRKENPKHLNTLANLEVVYKELHRQTESDRCRKEKEDILCSNDSEAMELKAQCVLEQAYSLIIEEATNHEGIANHRLRDSLKVLTSEHDRSSEERKEYLRQALRYAEQAISYVLSAMYCDRPDEKLERKKDAVGKFLQGLKLLESVGANKNIQYHIWRFTLGVAYNRYDYSIFLKEDDDEKEKCRADLTKNTLQIFLSTICDMNVTDKTGLYTARSYAYIGHLLVSRDKFVKNIVESENSSIFQKPFFQELYKDPMICFQRALKTRNKDIHVLNRYGKTLRNKANFKTSDDDDTQKLKYLLTAYRYLSLSIEILPHNNWFAYVTRMRTSKDLAFLLAKSENNIDLYTEILSGDLDSATARDGSDLDFSSERINSVLAERSNCKAWLEHARSDGIHCFNSKATELDLATLARVCEMLATYPRIKRYGPEFVENEEYIHEAISYLNYALQIGGFINFNVLFSLSRCLYEIKEYRTAIEWMKRAMDLSKTSLGPESLTRIVQYILALYKSKESKGNTSRMYLFNELWFWIQKGKAKFLNIDSSISYLCKFYADGMLAFINYLLDKQINSESSRSFTSSCLDSLKYWQGKKWRYKRSIIECEDKLNSLPPAASTVEQDIESSSQYTVPDIVMPFSSSAKIHHSKFQYDFFISHSNKNRDWVNNNLLHHLETKLHDNDTAFKGCIADRDFTPGSTIINNIISAVEHSCKVIFVITKHFIERRWCDYELDQALVEMLSTKKQDCIIPILLEKIPEEKIPQKIRHITYLDLTDESKHIQEVIKLKRALSF